jgi:hypothetical protein
LPWPPRRAAGRHVPRQQAPTPISTATPTTAPFHEVNYPTSSPVSPAVDQLPGVIDNDIAVGFYMSSSNRTFGYEYNIRAHRFNSVEPGLTDSTAAAINNRRDVAGFYLSWATFSR